MDPANNNQPDPPIFGTPPADTAPPSPPPAPVKTEPANYTPFTEQAAAAPQAQVVVASGSNVAAASTTPTPTSGGGKKKIVAGLIGLILLVGGIGAGLILVNQQQDIRKEAADGCNISVPSTLEVEVGGTVRLNVTKSGRDSVETVKYNITRRLTDRFTILCPSGLAAGREDPRNTGFSCKNPAKTSYGYYTDITGVSPGTWTVETQGLCRNGTDESGIKTTTVTVLGATPPPAANSCETCAGIAGTACSGDLICVIPGLKDANNLNAADLLGYCLPPEVAQNKEVEVDQDYIDNYCANGTGGVPTPTPQTPSPTPTPTINPTATATPTVSPTQSPLQSTNPTQSPTQDPGRGGGGGSSPVLAAQCRDIKIFDENWVQISSSGLSNLSAGDTIRITANATSSSGAFTKARFTINGVLRPEVTGKRPSTSEFYDEYVIPSGTTSFSVTAEVYHDSGIWI